MPSILIGPVSGDRYLFFEIMDGSTEKVHVRRETNSGTLVMNSTDRSFFSDTTPTLDHTEENYYTIIEANKIIIRKYSASTGLQTKGVQGSGDYSVNLQVGRISNSIVYIHLSCDK